MFRRDLTRRFPTYDLQYGSLLGNVPRVRRLTHVKYGPVFVFICPHALIVRHSGVSDNRKDSLTLPDDEDDMSPEDEAIRMVVPDVFFFCFQESRPAVLDNDF